MDAGIAGLVRAKLTPSLPFGSDEMQAAQAVYEPGSDC